MRLRESDGSLDRYPGDNNTCEIPSLAVLCARSMSREGRRNRERSAADDQYIIMEFPSDFFFSFTANKLPF